MFFVADLAVRQACYVFTTRNAFQVAQVVTSDSSGPMLPNECHSLLNLRVGQCLRPVVESRSWRCQGRYMLRTELERISCGPLTLA